MCVNIYIYKYFFYLYIFMYVIYMYFYKIYSEKWVNIIVMNRNVLKLKG